MAIHKLRHHNCRDLFGIYKGVCFVIDRQEARRKKRREEIEAQKPDLAKRVSNEVLNSMEPRIASMEKDLKRDKSRIDNHDFILSGMQESQADVRNGFSALFNVILVASRIGSFDGTNPEMKTAINKMNEYLTGRLKAPIVFGEGGTSK